MPREVILHYRRMRALPADGGRTLFCNVTYDGGIHGVLGYPTPGQFPEFDGEEAWFRVLWFSKRRFKPIERVADRSGSPIPARAG